MIDVDGGRLIWRVCVWIGKETEMVVSSVLGLAVSVSCWYVLGVYYWWRLLWGIWCRLSMFLHDWWMAVASISGMTNLCPVDMYRECTSMEIVMGHDIDWACMCTTDGKSLRGGSMGNVSLMEMVCDIWCRLMCMCVNDGCASYGCSVLWWYVWDILEEDWYEEFEYELEKRLRWLFHQ